MRLDSVFNVLNGPRFEHEALIFQNNACTRTLLLLMSLCVSAMKNYIAITEGGIDDTLTEIVMKYFQRLIIQRWCLGNALDNF